MKLKGKRVLITGASSGIGLALATECARAEALVTICARREDKLMEAARLVTSANLQNQQPLAVLCDVCNRDRVQLMVEQSVDRFGGVDVLINNAGISVYGSSDKELIEQCRNVMDVNFFGALNCVSEVLPHMKLANCGLIVNMTSVAALHGIPYSGAYCASKAALVAFSQSLRAELHGTGVSIMNVYPYYTATELFSHETKVGGARRPRHRYASPISVARKIVRAMTQDKQDLILSTQGRVLSLLQGLYPSFVERRMRKFAKHERENGVLK